MCVLTKDGATEMGCRGVWGVLGNRAVWGGLWYKVVKTEGTLVLEYLPMKLCMPPTIIVG